MINFEQSVNLSDNDTTFWVSEFHLQTDSNNEFARKGLRQANVSDLSEKQKCEQVSQVGYFISESRHHIGYFCSKTVFNLSKKLLTEKEIKILEKPLDFTPIPKNLNEPEIRKNFEDFTSECDVNGTFLM